MAAIDVAMQRSLRQGLVDLIVASLRPALERRDEIGNVEGQIDNVKTAFSSWDNCMNASYCKWPVIAIIIIGGLIILSVLWCVIRCCCCGLSCCCEFCYCLKCCECCGCCTPPRNSRHKYLDEPWIPPDQGYKPQDPMRAGPSYPPPGPTVPPFAGAAVAPAEVPQYAQFEVRKGGEDALPAMPSWEGASNKKVLEEEEHEMDQLNRPEATGQNAPLMSGSVPISGASSPSPAHSPPMGRSPYGPPGAGAPDGYFPPGQPLGDPRARSPQGYGQNNGVYGMGAETMGQGRQSPRALNDVGYNNMGAEAMGQGRQSPQVYNDPRYGPGAPYGQPVRQGSRDNYGRPPRQNPYDNYGQQDNQGFDMGPQRSPTIPNVGMPLDVGMPQERMTRVPPPQGDYNGGDNYNNPRRYASPGPQRQVSSESTRPLVHPSPQNEYPPNNLRPDPSPTSLQNTGGFDFNSGYSRPSMDPPAMGGPMGAGDDYGRRAGTPQQQRPDDYGRRVGTPQQQRPQQQSPPPQQQGAAYPGYRPYQAAAPQQPQGWN